MSISFQKDKRHGLKTTWYENGQKRIVADFIDDMMEGNSKGWFSNGQLAFDCSKKIKSTEFVPNGTRTAKRSPSFDLSTVRRCKISSRPESRGSCRAPTPIEIPEPPCLPAAPAVDPTTPAPEEYTEPAEEPKSKEVEGQLHLGIILPNLLLYLRFPRHRPIRLPKPLVRRRRHLPHRPSIRLKAKGAPHPPWLRRLRPRTGSRNLRAPSSSASATRADLRSLRK